MEQIMDNLEALRHAKTAFETRDGLTRDEKILWVKALAYYDLFSNSQIHNFTGMRLATTTQYTGKTDATGGRLNPESLGLIIKMIEDRKRDDISFGLVKSILDMGVSAGMLSRLTGVPTSTISGSPDVTVGRFRER